MKARGYCYDTLERNMVRIYDHVERFVDLDLPVLVTGRPGTGKRAVCELMHKKGKRRQAPLVSVNCAAIPENLIEAEFFGFYQGAVLVKGKLETARDGILVIQKIDELPLATQEKILETLKQKKFFRLGDQNGIDMHARLVATSEHEISDLVKQGSFNRELASFFECVVIRLPALTCRTRDIPILADHFLQELMLENRREVRFSPEVYSFLCQKNWNGNIRELKNYITRVYYLAEKNFVGLHDLYREGLEEGEVSTLSGIMPVTSGASLSLQEMEREYILRTLEITCGNKSQAARALKISLKTLRNKLRAYGAMPENLVSLSL